MSEKYAQDIKQPLNKIVDLLNNLISVDSVSFMTSSLWPCLAISIIVLLNSTFSATIIITPSDPNPIEVNPPTPNSNSPLIDTTYLVQIIKDYFGCAQFSNGICTRCENNYVLNIDGKCSRVSDGCRIFNIDQGMCTQCLKASVLIDGICYPLNSKSYTLKNNCVIWSSLQCLKCEKGYFLSSGTCKSVDAAFQCRIWNDKGLCLACNLGYFLLNGKCVPTQGLINCPETKYFASSGKCELLPANCETWDPYNGKCVKCFNEFEFVDWKCVCSSNGYCANQNCERYNLENRTKCDSCILGYTLQNGKCIDRSLPKNCLKWNQNKTTCAVCKEGFTINLSTRECIFQIQNCQKYDQISRCIACIQKYELIGSKCEQIAVIENCEKYQSQNKKQCSVCSIGFVLENNQCSPKPLPLNCLNWNQNKSACGQCKESFVLTSNGVCRSLIENCKTYESNGDCQTCSDKYQLVDKKCELTIVIINCMKYNPSNRFQCSQCIQGFIVQNGQCKQKSLPKNCQKWDDMKISCGQCKPKFIINTNGQCTQEIINCKKYTSSGECIACVESYEITDSICHLKSNTMNSTQLFGCDTWNFTSNKCKNCTESFDLSRQGYCFYNEDHCLERNQRSYCTKCQEGYVVIAGNCQIKSDLIIQSNPGCKILDWVNNNCLVCEADYVRIDNGECQKPIQNCIEQGLIGCTKCLTNFDLKNGKCQSFATSRCIEFQNGVCKRCQNSFALINGQCRTFKQLGSILLDYNQFTPQKLKDKIIIFTDKSQL